MNRAKISHRFLIKLLGILICCWGISTYSLAQCKQPISFIIQDITTQSVKVAWIDQNNGNASYELELVVKGQMRQQVPNLPSTTLPSTMVELLLPSTAYELYVRTVCSDGNRSKWTGPINFITHLNNPTACQTQIPLKDNGTETLIIDVNQAGIIGQNIFIESIDLILAHGWPADMKIWLESPSGDILTLISNQGLINDNFGNISDTLCQQVTRFSPTACQSISEENPPFIGSFLPQDDMFSFAKGTTSKGLWKLHLMDRAVKDIGTLYFFQIKFSEIQCLPPQQINLTNIADTSLLINWLPTQSCTNTILNIIYPNSTDTIQTIFNCRETSEIVRTITDLDPNKMYTYFLTNQCFLSSGEFVNSEPSCTKSFATLCRPVSAGENFDKLLPCEPSCNVSCSVNGSLFFNNNVGSNSWIVRCGSTPTENTGPTGDVTSNGNYAYIENNPDLCESGDTIIFQSVCMQVISNGGTCDMSFYTHMYGNDIQNLALQISNDNGDHWQTILQLTGDQGNRWIQHHVSLVPYHQTNASFRFIAVNAPGELGDIAIDEIQFFGSKRLNGDLTFYIDNDGDGFGSEVQTIVSCTSISPLGYVIKKGDCDDQNANINPGMIEITCNAVDENCNGDLDDSPSINKINYTILATDVSCAGQKDGAITLSISGGSSPYTVNWNDNITGNQRIKLKQGVYQATLTDAAGCKLKTSYIEIKALTTISIIDTKIHPSCVGKSDGAITIQHSNDNPPYLYKWSNNNEITKDISGLKEGKYNVIISDSKGCVTAKSNIELIAKPSIIIDTKIVKTPRCSGQQNGEIELFVIDGTPPYKYQWMNGDTTSKLINLPGGLYQCTVADSQNCLNTIEVDLLGPDSIGIVITNIENVRCFGEKNGSITTKINGGTQPYTYFWNYNALRTNNIFDIGSGTYIMTVTDNNGCQQITESQIIVAEPAILSLTLDSLGAARCLSGRNGYISTKIGGGTPSYQYKWSHTESSKSLYNDLKQGDYSVTAFDTKGCKSNSLLVTVPFYEVDLGLISKILRDNICPKSEDGSILLEISNGTPPYDYNWSDGRQYVLSNKKDSITMLAGGKYKATVTDAEGCVSITSEIGIASFDNISYTINDIVQNQCKTDSKALIAITAKGGTPPLMIDWNNGSHKGSLLFNLKNGKYAASIKDANGCIDSIKSINLTSISNITTQGQVTNANSNSNNGSACITVLGGAEPYRILWSNDIIDVPCITNLKPGNYTATISDALGCQHIDTFKIELASSINSNDLTKLVTVSPIPSSSQIYIEGQNITFSQYDILDSQGKQLDNEIFNDHISSVSLELGKYSPGIYFLRMKVKSGGISAIVWKKVIKI